MDITIKIRISEGTLTFLGGLATLLAALLGS